MAEFATNGKGNLGVTLGAIGTGLNLINSTGLLSGLNFGAVNDRYATKEDVETSITISAQKSEIDMLKSEQRENEKIIETYKELISRINNDKAEQQAINAQQSVYNCQANSNIAVLNNQVGQLMSLTALRIPNSSVCPGWGATATNVVYTPVSGGTTTA